MQLTPSERNKLKCNEHLTFFFTVFLRVTEAELQDCRTAGLRCPLTFAALTTHLSRCCPQLPSDSQLSTPDMKQSWMSALNADHTLSISVAKSKPTEEKVQRLSHRVTCTCVVACFLLGILLTADRRPAQLLFHTDCYQLHEEDMMSFI